jgi:hypothetical protein
MQHLGLERKYEEYTNDIQASINNEPAVKLAQLDVDEQSREFGSVYIEWRDEATTIYDQYNDLISAATKRMNPNDFRVRYGELMEKRSHDLKKNREDFDKKGAFDFIDDLKPETLTFNIAQNDYHEQIRDPALEDKVTGEYNFDESERRLEAFKDRYGEKMLALIETYNHRNDTKFVTELRRVRKILKPYWDVGDLFDLHHPGVVALEEESERKRKAGDIAGYHEDRKVGLLKEKLDWVKDEHKKMRRSNGGIIDAYLIVWYGKSPLHGSVGNQLAGEYIKKLEEIIKEGSRPEVQGVLAAPTPVTRAVEAGISEAESRENGSSIRR